MEKRSVTFIWVSERRGGARKITIPEKWIQLGILGLSVALVIAGAMLVDYFGLLSQSIENKQLKAENAILHDQFKLVEGKLNALERSLERVKVSTQKLKLITNVDDPNRELNLAMGPGARTGEDLDHLKVPLDERAPSSELKNQDEVFFQKLEPNVDGGELAVDGQRDYASLAIRIDQAVKETQLREQGVLELWEYLDERESLINATPSLKPVRGWFTSKFGYRLSPFNNRPVMHAGIDIAAAPGTPIYAPADGVVSFAGYDPGYGKLVSIDHGYGVVTRYGHNSQIFVKVGQRISRRDIVSAVGNTGRSTGPHLHYEVRVNNVPVDPSNYILAE